MLIDITEYPHLIYGAVHNDGEKKSFSRCAVSDITDLNFSAGVMIKFCTCSSRVAIKYALSERKKVQPHIGATLMNGLFYAVYRTNSHAMVKRGCCLTRTNDEVTEIFTQNAAQTPQTYCFEIYLPSFNEIESINVEIDDDSEIIKVNDTSSTTAVFLGGPLTLGSGCLFAAADFAHIVARKLNATAFNLGLNRNDFLDIRISKAVKYLCPNVIVVEAFNIWTVLKHLQDNLEAYLENLILECPNVPIIVLEQPYVGDANFNSKDAETRRIVALLNSKYKNRILLLSGKTYFGKTDSDEISYSANIINDYGHRFIADKILYVAEALLVK